jgi:signal transduction histidine kinase
MTRDQATGRSATPRQWWHRRAVADVGVVVVVEAMSAAALARDGDHRWWVWLLVQLLVVPLAWRRRRPTAVFALLAAVALVQWALDVRLVADLALLVALYTVAAHRNRRHWIPAAAVLEIGVVLASVRFAPAGDGVFGSLVFLSGLVTAALFLGTTLRTRREYLTSVEDRATRLERERDQQAQLAATAERTRIAREMHDVVAHSLSVIIALADGAAATHHSDPDEARGAMSQVAATGRQALGEMRRLLGILRDAAPAELAPQPTLERLDALLDDVRSAGLPARLAISGQPQPLPSTAEATVYRLVQESLTNVLKHADRPTTVDVTLSWAADALTVDVIDNGRTPTHADAGTGHGLRGMRERVALFDGDLCAGRAPSGGWRVHAVLRLAGETT